MFPLGGLDPTSLKSTEIYNIEDNTFSEGPDMYDATSAACGAVRQKTNKIYIVGGFHTTSLFETGTQIYDNVTRNFMPPIQGQLAVGRSHLGCSILEEEGLLIAAGGNAYGFVKNDAVEILNLSTETWSLAGQMPNDLGNMWTATGGFIFLRGASVYQYVPRSDLWFKIEDLPISATDIMYHTQVFDTNGGRPCMFL